MGNRDARIRAGVKDEGCAAGWEHWSVLSVNSTIEQGWKRTYRKGPGQEKSIRVNCFPHNIIWRLLWRNSFASSSELSLCVLFISAPAILRYPYRNCCFQPRWPRTQRNCSSWIYSSLASSHLSILRKKYLEMEQRLSKTLIRNTHSQRAYRYGTEPLE